MTTYRVVLCDHPDCTKAATVRATFGDLPEPSVGPLLIPEMVPDPPALSVEACDAHAAELRLDPASGFLGWPTAPAEPREIPAEGRSWTLIDGGKGRRAQ